MCVCVSTHCSYVCVCSIGIYVYMYVCACSGQNNHFCFAGNYLCVRAYKLAQAHVKHMEVRGHTSRRGLFSSFFHLVFWGPVASTVP